MKKVLMMICLIASIGIAAAQDETTFTDEDLTSYATVMAWAKTEQGKMTEVYNGWIRDSENLEPVRFSEIDNAIGDSLKLSKISVIDVELTAYKEIKMRQDSMVASFKDIYIGKIKSDIGAGLYNSLKKALKTDAEVKSRYQVFYDGLVEEQTTQSDESDD